MSSMTRFFKRSVSVVIASLALALAAYGGPIEPEELQSPVPAVPAAGSRDGVEQPGTASWVCPPASHTCQSCGTGRYRVRTVNWTVEYVEDVGMVCAPVVTYGACLVGCAI